MLHWHRPKNTATNGGRDAGRLQNRDQASDNPLLQSLGGGSRGRFAAPILVRPLVGRQLGPLPESGESSREALLGRLEAFPGESSPEFTRWTQTPRTKSQ
jgi:hypothetical protein